MNLPPPAPVATGYPARLDVTPEDPIGRWRPLFQWVLAIPHLVVANVLSSVAQVLALIAWFAILFTGKMPAGMANFICMAHRYNTRTMTYAAGVVSPYPPFEFDSRADDPGAYAARVDFAPELVDRNRLTVGLRLIWAIPALIVTLVIGIIGVVCWLIGAIVVLFTGSWPAGLRNWVMKAVRANLRLNAYMYLLTDQYPPLSFD